MSPSTRRVTALVATAATLSLLAGCGDANLKKLNAGITRDSVLKILAIGSTATDSMPNVYREERYLQNGQWITMLLYTNTGRKEGVETVPEEELTPVVLRNDTLTGWGWEHHDSVARANNIVIKPRGK